MKGGQRAKQNSGAVEGPLGNAHIAACTSAASARACNLFIGRRLRQSAAPCGPTTAMLMSPHHAHAGRWCALLWRWRTCVLASAATGDSAQHPGVEWQPCHAAAVLGHQGCSRQVSQMRCLCCCWQALHAFLPAYCRHVQPLSEHRMPCTACLLLVPTGCTWPKLLEIFSRQAAWWHGGVC